MEGDPRNPKISLLKKYDIPIDHISYEYVANCTDKKELERIVRILRSGEEGFYPDLLGVTENRLRLFAPDSRVLRQEMPALTKDCLSSEEWNAVEKELLSWEEEMMVIDKSLNFENSRLEYVGNKNIPDIRKISKPGQKSKPVSRSQHNSSQNNNRIKSGDYASWDKFDVDKELLKIDVEQERKEEENEKKKREMKKVAAEKKIEINVDKDSYSSMEQQVLATQAKDRGNECFKSGDLTNALKYYNVSLKLYSSVNAHNNRAMTYLKLGQYDEAVKDCNEVLLKEKNNVKALHRRATAYQNLATNTNNFDMLALEDLKEIVSLEPNNKVAQLDLHKLKIKLGIQDLGKKFRMPIHETDQNSIKQKTSANQNQQEKSKAYVKDVPKNVDKLPLTYYGPSTSSFKCEPYSMDHRALSGSFLTTEVMCKCNSNIPKQNPLCQRCGEAMCTPKPIPKANLPQTKTGPTIKTPENPNKPTSKLETKTNKEEKPSQSDTDNKIENKLTEKCKRTTIEASPSKSKGNNQTPCPETKINPIELQIGASDKQLNNVLNQEKNLIQSKVEGNDKTAEKESTNSDSIRGDYSKGIHFNAKDNQLGRSEAKEKKNITDDKIIEVKPLKLENMSESKALDLCNIEETKKETNSGKSKAKKKKSKNHRKKNLSLQDDLERMTPVKVVHAAKYLHPTSVEPRVEPEKKKKPEPEINLTGNNQFKAFVPNRQCFSVRGNVDPTGNHVNSPSRKSAATSGETAISVLSKIEMAASLEGNKENVLENANAAGNGENSIGKIDPEEKPQVDNLSPYEFAMLWDILQKSDHTYAKRARIIRSVDPTKLGGGVKLNYEMLITLLECLDKQFVETEPNIVVDILKQLPKIPRFGLIKMFLGDADKKVMKNLIDAAESKGFSLEEDTRKGLTS